MEYWLKKLTAATEKCVSWCQIFENVNEYEILLQTFSESKSIMFFMSMNIKFEFFCICIFFKLNGRFKFKIHLNELVTEKSSTIRKNLDWI